MISTNILCTYWYSLTHSSTEATILFSDQIFSNFAAVLKHATQYGCESARHPWALPVPNYTLCNEGSRHRQRRSELRERGNHRMAQCRYLTYTPHFTPSLIPVIFYQMATNQLRKVVKSITPFEEQFWTKWNSTMTQVTFRSDKNLFNLYETEVHVWKFPY